VSWLEWLLLGLLALWVIVSILWMRKRRKKGRCIGCGGDCSRCAYRGNRE